jgi:hypothetical protein
MKLFSQNAPAVSYRNGDEEQKDTCYDPLPVHTDEEGEEKRRRGKELRPEPLQHRLKKHAPQGHVLFVRHVRKGIEVIDEMSDRHKGVIPLMKGGWLAFFASNSAWFSKALAFTGTKSSLLGFPCSTSTSYRRVA